MKQQLLRLDRIAGQMNAWLLVIAIGLGMLDLAILIAKSVPVGRPPPAATSAGAGEHAGLLLPFHVADSRS